MEIPETQQKILNSAKRWFLEKGFKSAPLRKIVNDVGFTLGAFYGYYKNKEELFYALTDETAQGPCHHCTLHRGGYAEDSHQNRCSIPCWTAICVAFRSWQIIFALTGKKWCYYFAVLRERSMKTSLTVSA